MAARASDVVVVGAGPTGLALALYFSPAGLLVVAPLPEGLHRVVATVDESPEVPSIDFVQSLLDERGPEHERAVVSEIVWGSRFHVAHRLAETYRVAAVAARGDQLAIAPSLNHDWIAGPWPRGVRRRRGHDEHER